jgi:hypothetical protein
MADLGIPADSQRRQTALADPEQSREAFGICADLIRRAATTRSLAIERDAAKVQSLTEEIRILAVKENDRKSS